MKHSEEKIRTNRGMGDMGVDVSFIWTGEKRGDGRLMGEVFHEEFAQRIVACVNACEGVTDEELKSLAEPDINGAGNLLNGTVRTIKALNDALDQSEKEKKELLKACKKLLETGGDGPDIDKSDEAYTLAEQAIASAEEGEHQ